MIISKLTHFCPKIQQIHVINSYHENLASEITSVNKLTELKSIKFHSGRNRQKHNY